MNSTFIIDDNHGIRTVKEVYKCKITLTALAATNYSDSRCNHSNIAYDEKQLDQINVSDFIMKKSEVAKGQITSALV